jgi:hypothetical protein
VGPAIVKSAKRKNGALRGRGALRRREPSWARWPDEDLLQLRLCDLDLRIEGTALEERIGQLYEELEYRGLQFKPHFWLAEEWFSPDGVPGIAIPFYLAHPRLARLERKQMLEVEGGSKDWCLMILRHETGHAIDTAFRLHLRKHYRELFGRYTDPYPEHYRPKPYSKSYVQHLEPWYAQAHPAEDFAETFAVWLKPRSRWRTHYAGWPAIKKLDYVNQLMKEIRDERPRISSREHIEPLRSIRKTLWEHYQQKRDRYGLDHPNFYDQDLRKLFTDSREFASQPSAAAFLRRMRPELRKAVAYWTGQYQYMIDQVLVEMITRCRELNLRMDRSPEQAKQDAMVLLTMQTMNYLHGGHHRVAL